ncbi:hypothetical protein HLRTI_001813 [Halorhabdus tiamatea SARL4B]|uniref:Uncharacterized protein n=1 Tax=Halorhabdus tiamatea SARL4B TaxID=1033806 RepID=F7PKQ5_9EURY|nr:hypothetical protein HLRTI_001813 [Halorhabdus tiamatea SARL4B]
MSSDAGPFDLCNRALYRGGEIVTDRCFIGVLY